MSVTRHGPSIGVFRDKPIPTYIITDDGCRHTFRRTTAELEDVDGGFELALLASNESVISPGLIYRADRSGAMAYNLEIERLVAHKYKLEAEIKRLQDDLLNARRLSFDWMKKHDSLLGFIQARPLVLKELIEQDRPVDKRGTER